MNSRKVRKAGIARRTAMFVDECLEPSNVFTSWAVLYRAFLHWQRSMGIHTVRSTAADKFRQAILNPPARATWSVIEKEKGVVGLSPYKRDLATEKDRVQIWDLIYYEWSGSKGSYKPWSSLYNAYERDAARRHHVVPLDLDTFQEVVLGGDIRRSGLERAVVDVRDTRLAVRWPAKPIQEKVEQLQLECEAKGPRGGVDAEEVRVIVQEVLEEFFKDAEFTIRIQKK